MKRKLRAKKTREGKKKITSINERKEIIYTEDQNGVYIPKEDEIFVPYFDPNDKDSKDKPVYKKCVSNYGTALKLDEIKKDENGNNVKNKKGEYERIARVYKQTKVPNSPYYETGRVRTHKLVWFSFAYETLDPERESVLPFPDIQYPEKIDSLKKLIELGRKKDYQIHHKDLTPENNSLENLRLMYADSHDLMHKTLDKIKNDSERFKKFSTIDLPGNPKLSKVFEIEKEKSTGDTKRLDYYDIEKENLYEKKRGIKEAEAISKMLATIAAYVRMICREDYFKTKRIILIGTIEEDMGLYALEDKEDGMEPWIITDKENVNLEDIDVVWTIIDNGAVFYVNNE